MKEKVLKESKALTEAPGDEVVDATLPPEYTVDPKPFRIRDILDRRIQKQRADKAAEEEAKGRSELAAKYFGITDKIKEGLKTAVKPSDVLDDIFHDVVPRSGKADSVGGEIVRAMMRILYRDYNDGDIFYSGYGVETAAPSVCYLIDTVEESKDSFERIVEHQFKEDEYTDALEDITSEILQYLVDNSHLFGEPNEEDSRDYSTEWVEDNIPMTSTSIEFSDGIKDLYDSGVIDRYDIINYVENALDGMARYGHTSPDIRVYRDYVDIDDITDEVADEIESIRDFWKYLEEDYADDLKSLYNEGEDEDYEDEEENDESMDEALHGKDEIKSFFKMAKQLGITNMKDLQYFMKNEKEPGESEYDAMLRYRASLGNDFKIKEDLNEEKCVLCGGEIKGYGNNPAPLADEGRCCDDCNKSKVIPARMSKLKDSDDDDTDDDVAIFNESCDCDDNVDDLFTDEDEEALKKSGIFEELNDAGSSDKVFYESLNVKKVPIKESNDIKDESINFIPDDSI